jgi:hypothetical protein
MAISSCRMQVKLRKVKLASSPSSAAVNDQPRKTIDGSNDGLIAMLIALEDRQHLSEWISPRKKRLGINTLFYV